MRRACLYGPLLSAALGAQAQDVLPGIPMPTGTSSEFLLGLGVTSGPAYLGSDERKTRALPLLAARWRNGWFAGTGGIGYRFEPLPSLSLGPRLTFDFGRDEDDADALRGMGDIDARPELGGFVSYALLPGLSVSSSLRYGSGNDRDGLTMDLGLRGGFPVTPALRLTAGLTTTFANTKSMQSLFGVTAAQSLSTGYANYTPGSGLRDMTLHAGGMLRLGEQTMLVFGLNGRRLMGDAVESPLTRQRNSASAFATLAWRL
jgi:MipA family protein